MASIDVKSFNDVNYIDIKHKQTFAGQEILGTVNDVIVSVDEGGNVVSINGDWRNWTHHKNLTVNTTPQDAVNEIIDMRNFESDERFSDGKYIIHEIDFDVNVVYALEKNGDPEEYLVPYWDVHYRIISEHGGQSFNEQISVG